MINSWKQNSIRRLFVLWLLIVQCKILKITTEGLSSYKLKISKWNRGIFLGWNDAYNWYFSRRRHKLSKNRVNHNLKKSFKSLCNSKLILKYKYVTWRSQSKLNVAIMTEIATIFVEKASENNIWT